MFKLQEISSIKWPVTINIPRDNGNTVKATMTVEFELIPEDEYKELMANGGDIAILDRTITGWGNDYCDHEGNPIPFSEEARTKLVRITYAKLGLINAYIECAYGNKSSKSAKEKN